MLLKESKPEIETGEIEIFVNELIIPNQSGALL